MPLKRRSDARVSQGLRLDVADFLIGFDRPQAEIEALQAEGVAYDQFLEFSADEPQAVSLLAETLRRHRPELAREARRRGLTPAWMTADERSLR